MAWLFVPGLADLSSVSGSHSPVIAPSVTSRGKRLLPPAWSRAWQKVRWIRRLSGTTYSRSTADAGVDTFIASLPGSPVSRGARPAKAKAPRTSDGSGPPSRELLATFDPISCSLKTSRPSLFEADSPSSSLTLPLSVSMRNQRVCLPATLARATGVSGSSFWPTAVVTDGASSARGTTTTDVMHPGTSLSDAIRTWPSPTAQDSEAAGGLGCIERGLRGPSLTNAAQRLWPTPTQADDDRGNDGEANREGSPSLTGATAMWATPLKRDYRSGEGTQKRVGSPALNEQVSLWATPVVPSGGRTMSDADVANKGTTAKGKRQVDLANQIRCWPTPAATPYGSSQNGINGKGGEHERPSANTPGLEKMSHSFLLLPATSTRGDESSPNDLSSPQPSQWKTPHGFANTDQYGRTGGGGGEFHKQAMAVAETWSTPRAQCNSPDQAVTALTGGDTTRTVANSSKPKLNANFVEWLMGWPIGWTASALAATAWCRWQQRMRSEFLRLASASGLPVDDSLTEEIA